MKPINILTFCPGPDDATSFYRGLGPLYEMQRCNYRLHNGEEFHLRIIEGNPHRLAWPQIAQADIVFIQRPHQPVLAEIAKLTLKMGRALWVDLDDDHLDVPTHNPHFKIYNDPDNVLAHRTILKLADTVSFSTEYLRKTYIARRDVTYEQCITIANALPFYLDALQLARDTADDFVHIVWRGSEKHSRDLARFLPALNRIATMQNVRLTFFGYRPEVENPRHTVQFIPHLRIGDITGYFQTLWDIAPDLLIVPLEFSQHNRCKSNIAMLEGHWAGAHVIGPAMEGWEKCDWNYATYDQFLVQVENYVHMRLSKQLNPRTPVRDSRLEYIDNIRAIVINKLYRESQLTRFPDEKLDEQK